jgi:spore coat polysaccharide biosynthesis protein SpsF (cytidylyltransferase family)
MITPRNQYQGSSRRTIAVILARMGSSRLPSKAMAEVAGKPIIAHIIERLKYLKSIDQVVLATPETPNDLPLQKVGREAGAKVFGGAEKDVLDRLYQAAKAYRADLVVHVGGDCPFVDPKLAQKALDLLNETGADYACNILPLTYPSGMDIDVLTFAALERAWKSATLRTTRRHPLAYIYQNREEFRIANFSHEPNLGHLRWTLDYPEDLEFVRAVYGRLYARQTFFGMEEILKLLELEPEIGKINAGLSNHVNTQPAYWDSEGYLGDLRLDVRDALNQGIAADERKDFSQAMRHYQIAQRLLNELYERSAFLRR